MKLQTVGLMILVVLLALVGAGCGAMAFEQEGANMNETTQGGELAGSSWTLTAFGDGTAVAEQPSTLSFDAEGTRVGGKGGVNRYNGAVTISGQAISFGPAASTRMAGPPDLMAQEDTFFRALSDVAAYQIDGDQLTLADADGNALLIFART